MDEFLVLLAIAFVTLAALMVFSGPLADLSFGGGEKPSQSFETFTTFDLGRVGFSESEVSRVVNFGSFNLGQPQLETLKEMGSVFVERGYFGEDKKTFIVRVDDAYLPLLKKVRITFDLDESNLYGNLVLRWNGKIVFDRKANLKNYEVDIEPDSVKEDNTLEIYAREPGPFFWASTIYHLRNLRVIAELGKEKIVSFKVYPSDIEAWSEGILRFYATRGEDSEVVIKLNGYEIYRNNPSHLVEVTLNYSDVGNRIKIGDNILTFRSENPIYIDDAQLEIRLSTANVVKQREFTLNEEDINKLKSGRGQIAFDVQSIYRQGVLDIEINGRKLNIQSIREGENTIEYTEDFVREGKNVIKFSGTGSWEIDNVRIGVAY